MKKSKELAIIKELTNVDDDNRIVLNEIGWTSRAYIVDNPEHTHPLIRSYCGSKKAKKVCHSGIYPPKNG